MELAVAAFESPIFDPQLGFWRRAMHLPSGHVDVTPHYYYGLCNLYGIVQAKRLLPELSKWNDALSQAAQWLFREVAKHSVLGYDSPNISTHLDQYSCALLPAALCAGYEVLQDDSVLSMARKVYDAYRDRFPLGGKRCVQASNHIVLSALSLHELTGCATYKNEALQEVRFLLDNCRLTGVPAAGTFTDDGRLTGFSRHCYGSWALMAMNDLVPSQEYQDGAARSCRWWKGEQRPSGMFPFFYDAKSGCWLNTTVYAVHQQGMLLLSAWDIAAHFPNEFDMMIELAMSACLDDQWISRSPSGWSVFRRSDRQTDVVYSYELGWQILGLAKGHAYRSKP